MRKTFPDSTPQQKAGEMRVSHKPFSSKVFTAFASLLIFGTLAWLEWGGELVPGNTPLYAAIYSHDPIGVARLLSEGADPNSHSRGLSMFRAREDAGWGMWAFDDPPIVEAVNNGNAEIVRLLLQHGANPNVRSQVGSTPLIDAVNHNDETMVRLLLQAGADVNVRTEVRGETVWCWGAPTYAPKKLTLGVTQALNEYRSARGPS